MRATEALRQQAQACITLGSPMYGALLDVLADDLGSGGPTAEVLAGHEDDPGPSALGVRLLGSIHRLVLAGDAPDLSRWYPTTGGSWEPTAGSAAVLTLLADSQERVREWLDRPPQTNEVGRSAALMAGLLSLPAPYRLPVRLHEVGASAGLNLLADRFCYVDDAGRRFGTADSRVVLEQVWRSPAGLLAWPGLQVVERLGCDLAPIDPVTIEGRLALTAYVWPDQHERHTRLRAALELARDVPVEVRRQGAADFLDTIGLAEGTTTVIWHSVMWQYLGVEEQHHATARIDRLGSRATATAPLVHVRLEPTRRTTGSNHEFLITSTTWPDGQERILGSAAPHGLPVRWDDAVGSPLRLA